MTTHSIDELAKAAELVKRLRSKPNRRERIEEDTGHVQVFLGPDPDYGLSADLILSLSSRVAALEARTWQQMRDAEFRKIAGDPAKGFSFTSNLIPGDTP